MHGLQLGDGLKHMGLSLVRFDEQNKLGDACRSTSLEDGGDDSFREPLQILVDICDREARLTLIDRLAAKHDALRLLMTRLRFVHVRITTRQIIDEYFALPFTNQAKDGMEKFLKDNPQNKHEARTYSLSQFGPSSEYVLSHVKHDIHHFHLDLGSS